MNHTSTAIGNAVQALKYAKARSRSDITRRKIDRAIAATLDALGEAA